jgi:hypothetical protein
MQCASISESFVLEQEALLGFLRYTQLSWPVRDFPPPDDPSWSNFVHNVITDPKLGKIFKKPFNVGSVLHGAVEVDPCTRRIRIDPEGARGRMLGERYPDLAHSLRTIGYETRCRNRELITLG